MGSSGPVLPQEGKRNVLITSNIIGSVLSADVFARFCKARGHQTLYVCGSDEYGTATETKALEEGLEPAALCAKYHALHKGIYDWFRIDFDVFGRTPTAQQTQIVQQVFSDLWKNGFIEERETTQPFCPTPAHSKFLADRFVEGECSICHDSGARGDQCDTCGSLLDAFQPERNPNTTEEEDIADVKATGWLINPHCKLDGATPERRQTKHLFLRLDALRDELVAWFKKSSKEGEWSPNCTSVTQAWIDKGLLPRGITRDLKWGVPIPRDLEGLSNEEYAQKVFYVWFDACIGYMSITKGYTDGDDLEGNKWEQWWKNPENVKLYQFMGKDNIPFHTIIFPASQLGAGGKWTQVHKLSTTEYLNYEGGKFSKSKGVGVFGNTAKDTGVDPDVWRYYLLSRRPESSDSEFKWQEFIDCNNNDLLKNLGNLNQRILKFCQIKMNGLVPDYTKYTDDRLEEHKKEVNESLQAYVTNLEGIKLRAGLASVMHISGLGNKLLQDSGLNNQLLADHPDRCAAVIGLGINHLQLLASILHPYMPSTAEAILTQIGSPGHIAIPDTWAGDSIKPGQKIGEPKLLFTQIPATQLDQWREAFGGEEIRKQKALEADKAAAKKAARDKKKQKKLAVRVAEKASTAAPAEAAPVEASAPEKAAETPAPPEEKQ
ncbi:hypothetical protein G7046_g10025 [Stylonectria norvegica]|nr:hypothetical protein G7046_g10025 [Stylonectria norvegica]